MEEENKFKKYFHLEKGVEDVSWKRFLDTLTERIAHQERLWEQANIYSVEQEQAYQQPRAITLDEKGADIKKLVEMQADKQGGKIGAFGKTVYDYVNKTTAQRAAAEDLINTFFDHLNLSKEKLEKANLLKDMQNDTNISPHIPAYADISKYIEQYKSIYPEVPKTEFERGMDTAVSLMARLEAIKRRSSYPYELQGRIDESPIDNPPTNPINASNQIPVEPTPTLPRQGINRVKSAGEGGGVQREGGKNTQKTPKKPEKPPENEVLEEEEPEKAREEEDEEQDKPKVKRKMSKYDKEQQDKKRKFNMRKAKKLLG